MDASQEQTVIQSIAISSGASGSLPVSPEDRRTAFRVLEEFKRYEGRVSTSLRWLGQEQVVSGNNGASEATIPVKLYAISVIQEFLSKSYSRLSEQDRLALRHAVLTAAGQLAPLSPLAKERVLANKLAALLAGLVVRDFPQRWTTFVQDVLTTPVRLGGLWCNESGGDSLHIMGVKMCLACLRAVTEDCTDSDFNLRISTKRRNDVMIGLNEVSSQFLPQLFGLLEHYAVLSQTKETLHNMRIYLSSSGRSLAQMTAEEAPMYSAELQRLNLAAQTIRDCLQTLTKFCQAMPLDWTMSATPDFAAAILHLLREPLIQVDAITCLEALAQRKLDASQWMRLIAHLPPAITEANSVAQTEQEHLLARRAVGDSTVDNTTDPLVQQLPFHQLLSKTMATLISGHISHITADKALLKKRGPKFDTVAAYLRLLVDLLHHPSGRLCGEQISCWINLFRDPQIHKTDMLRPLVEEILTCYMDHLIKIRWDDVVEQVHPITAMIESSWYDEDEYDAWIGDLRSKSSTLFKFMGNVEPLICIRVLNSRIRAVIAKHGNGEPRDHLDPTNSQLTPKSEAVRQFEALYHPLDFVLHGIPKWALVMDDALRVSDNKERQRIRAEVCSNVEQLATIIVSWKPTYLFLKFRKANLIDGLKYFWRYNPASLLQGIDSLLNYLTEPDDWKVGNLQTSGLTGETIGLRKKSGVALVSVSKQVPHHLLPWLSQLSEATQRQLSNPTLLPVSRNYLYEFLTCVATAVQDPLVRSNFVSEVLSDALSVVTSPAVNDCFSSLEKFLIFMGIAQVGTNPGASTNPQVVHSVTDSFVGVFSALNQLLSVGKRCNEAAKRRPNGGLPVDNLAALNELELNNFPDEGPVSLQALAMNDPFVPLWPRILPFLLKVIDMSLRVWHPETQTVLLRNELQRFALAISDDEAYLAKFQDGHSGGVFCEGGTAGSIVSGTDRRDLNLVPRWSGWFNELRNTCFQMLGLAAAQRALFAPELADVFPQLVGVTTNPAHLRAMESRHLTQYLKQFLELLMVACPSTLYASHLGPVLHPVLEHLQYRLEKTWEPVVNPSSSVQPQPLSTGDCNKAAELASKGGEAWLESYYARNGLFVGDLDPVTAEVAVEKSRVDCCRAYADMLQAAFALKGDWSLVLANNARQEQAQNRNSSRQQTKFVPKNQVPQEGVALNADGSQKKEHQGAVDARKTLRINKICRYMLLEDERIAGNLTLSIVQCLQFPDAYTVRRCTRLCHRILETAGWVPRYVDVLTNRMFLIAVKNIVTEPKWMVGIEWDMINVIRDIYCRLVLGQYLQFGGQGAANQQPRDPNNPDQFEQSKNVDRPLLGGGVQVVPSYAPRDLLVRIPGIGPASVIKLENDMNQKRSAKDQKDLLRDLLRVAAENSKGLENVSGRQDNGIFDRAGSQEALLHQKSKYNLAVQDIPEKLVTHSMLVKKHQRSLKEQEDPQGLADFFKS